MAGLFTPSLFPECDDHVATFPRTRYQGSKRRLTAAILDAVRDLDFDTVLDAFGGTGAVSYAFKCAGKAVTYNDILAFNHQVGLALIENDAVRLDDETIDSIIRPQPGVVYPDFIQRTFQGIYFTDEENRWLDVAVGNIRRLTCPSRRALAWFALFQSAMAKRPYNLFHRKNLYMRMADVKRSFGNKASWDRGFADHFRAFAAEANGAIVDSGRVCRALCRDVLDVEPGYDLVYIDTPYINHSGVGVDYRHFYHFLEGLARYDEWPRMVDYGSKHRRLATTPDPWSDDRRVHDAFVRLFERFADSLLVVSYRSDGIPTIDELAAMMRRVTGRVRIVRGDASPYVLSTNRCSREVLLVGVPYRPLRGPAPVSCARVRARRPSSSETPSNDRSALLARTHRSA